MHDRLVSQHTDALHQFSCEYLLEDLIRKVYWVQDHIKHCFYNLSTCIHFIYLFIHFFFFFFFS